MPVITLTTEWRPDDIYTGIIKGRLCTLCPGVTVIDNAFGITPFDISHAAFIVRNTFVNYPKGSIHIICVHSEAEKPLKHLIVRARDHYFIGTDNGIFSLILNSNPDEVVAIETKDSTDELEIFAAAAAGINEGRSLAQLGSPPESVSELIPLRATIDKEVIIGSVIFIDSYGNAISNITREIFLRIFDKRKYRIAVQSTKNYTEKISVSYSDVPVGDLLARFNSIDLLEISINGADISELLSLEVGSSVRIEAVNDKAPADKLF